MITINDGFRIPSAADLGPVLNHKTLKVAQQFLRFCSIGST